MEDVVFKFGYPLTAKEDEGSGEAEGDDKDADDEDVEVKTEKQFSHLMGRFDMESEEQKDVQPFIALQASWESSIGKVTILGKITEDFGKPRPFFAST